MKFEVDDYNNLGDQDKKVVDKLIYYLKLPSPDNMKNLSNDENFKLKTKYEILIGELAAGNHGKLLIDEIKDTLKKLNDNKGITKYKYSVLLKAINNFN